jgi:YVTN family beta-propeller protein
VNNGQDAAAPTTPIPALGWRSALRDMAVGIGRFYHQHLRLAAADEPAVEQPADNVAPGGLHRAAEFSAIAQIVVNNGATGGMAASPDGSRLVVTNYGDDGVSIIDTGTYAVIETVPGISEPFAIAIGNTAPNCAYVSTASPSYDAITAVDLSTNTVVATHPVARSVSDVAVSPDGKHVYASRTGSTGADVAVLGTVTGRIDVIDIAVAPGTTTECLRISPNGQRLYVATQARSGGEVVEIDTAARRVINTIDIGSPIRDIAVSPDGGTAYVVSCDPDFGGVIDVIDTRARMVTGSLKIGEGGGFLTQLALSGDGERAYLVGDEGVMVLCPLTFSILATITVGAQPSFVIESPDGNRLYVADYSGAVTVISNVSSTASSAARAAGDAIIASPDLLRLDSCLV